MSALSNPPPPPRLLCDPELMIPPDLSRENIHLQPYDSEDDFYDRLYPRYQQLLKAAEQYVKETDADPRRTVVFIR